MFRLFGFRNSKTASNKRCTQKMKTIPVVLMGCGGVGRQLLHHIVSSRSLHAKLVILFNHPPFSNFIPFFSKWVFFSPLSKFSTFYVLRAELTCLVGTGRVFTWELWESVIASHPLWCLMSSQWSLMTSFYWSFVNSSPMVLLSSHSLLLLVIPLLYLSISLLLLIKMDLQFYLYAFFLKELSIKY